MPEQLLHLQIKDYYKQQNDLVEGYVWGYKVDIVRGDQLLEIQTGNFQIIREKVRRLLKSYKVRIIYPLILKKWLIREQGLRKIRRISQHRGRIEEIFNELIYSPDLTLNPNFSLEVLFIQAEEDQEIKWRGKKRTRYRVVERRLLKVIDLVTFSKPSDYISLLPEGLSTAFTARELSRRTGMKITLARRMVYCLTKMNLLKEVGKVARAKLYKLNDFND